MLRRSSFGLASHCLPRYKQLGGYRKRHQYTADLPKCPASFCPQWSGQCRCYEPYNRFHQATQCPTGRCSADSQDKEQFFKPVPWCREGIFVVPGIGSNADITKDVQYVFHPFANRYFMSIIDGSRNWGECLSASKASITLNAVSGMPNHFVWRTGTKRAIIWHKSVYQVGFACLAQTRVLVLIMLSVMLCQEIL